MLQGYDKRAIEIRFVFSDVSFKPEFRFIHFTLEQDVAPYRTSELKESAAENLLDRYSLWYDSEIDWKSSKSSRNVSERSEKLGRSCGLSLSSSGFTSFDSIDLNGLEYFKISRLNSTKRAKPRRRIQIPKFPMNYNYLTIPMLHYQITRVVFK